MAVRSQPQHCRKISRRLNIIRLLSRNVHQSASVFVTRRALPWYMNALSLWMKYFTISWMMALRWHQIVWMSRYMFYGLVFGVFLGLLVGHRWLFDLTKCRYSGAKKIVCAWNIDVLTCCASLPSLSSSPVPCVTDETLLTDFSSPIFLFSGRNRFTVSPRRTYLTGSKLATCRIACNTWCSRPHRRHRSIVLSQTRDLRKQIKHTRWSIFHIIFRRVEQSMKPSWRKYQV